MNKVTALLLCIFMSIAFAVSVFSDNAAELAAGIISQRSSSISSEKILSAVNAGEADWFAIGMSRLGADEDYSAYAEKTKLDVIKRYNELGGLDRARSTEWARAILVLLACGENPSDVDGINLINDGVYCRENLGRQGLNAYCWALIAITAAQTAPPADALNTPDTIISEIMGKQLPDGGYSLTGKAADADVTSLVITALSPYAQRTGVSESVQRAIAALSAIQNADGGFSSMGTPNCESTAQALTALCSAGVDIRKDERFIKNGKTVLDGLLLYRLENGSFCHITDKPSANPIASEQALYALTALERSDNSETALFDFGGVIVQSENEITANGDNSPNAETTANGNNSLNAETTANRDNSTNTETTANGDNSTNAYIGIQQIASIIFFAAALILCGVWLWRRRKDLLVIAVICAVGGVLLCVVSIKSTEEFYSDVENLSDKSVVLSISCEKAVEKGLPENLTDYISADGKILDKMQIPLNDGDSAFDVLLRAAKIDRIQLEYSGEGDSAYIRSISNLYEYDMGELSGWMFRVNGEFPDSSCGAYRLNNGDSVDFLYSLDLGRDVGDSYAEQ